MSFLEFKRAKILANSKLICKSHETTTQNSAHKSFERTESNEIREENNKFGKTWNSRSGPTVREFENKSATSMS